LLEPDGSQCAPWAGGTLDVGSALVVALWLEHDQGIRRHVQPPQPNRLATRLERELRLRLNLLIVHAGCDVALRGENGRARGNGSAPAPGHIEQFNRAKRLLDPALVAFAMHRR